MIQRIQTIWFLLAAVAAGLTLKLPTYNGSDAHLRPNIDLTGTATFPLLALTLLTALAAFAAIFLYKNRRRQVTVVVLALVLEFIVCFLYYREIAKFSSGTVSIFAALHAAVILFLFLGLRGVKHDTKLLRESDRLR